MDKKDAGACGSGGAEPEMMEASAATDSKETEDGAQRGVGEDADGRESGTAKAPSQESSWLGCSSVAAPGGCSWWGRVAMWSSFVHSVQRESDYISPCVGVLHVAVWRFCHMLTVGENRADTWAHKLEDCLFNQKWSGVLPDDSWQYDFTNEVRTYEGAVQLDGPAPVQSRSLVCTDSGGPLDLGHRFGNRYWHGLRSTYAA